LNYAHLPIEGQKIFNQEVSRKVVLKTPLDGDAFHRKKVMIIGNCAVHLVLCTNHLDKWRPVPPNPGPSKSRKKKQKWNEFSKTLNFSPIGLWLLQRPFTLDCLLYF